MSKDQKNGIQVIARAARILRLLKDNQSGLSLGQISKQVLLPRSTVQRIVNALQTERLVISTAAGRGLRLGPEINALAQATNYNVVETCRLFLTELTEVTGETADLSVLRGAGVIFLDQVPGTQRLRTVSSVGEVFPLTTTANGMACLSRLSPKSAHLLVADEWDRRNIVSNIQKMEQKLSDIIIGKLDNIGFTKQLESIKIKLFTLLQEAVLEKTELKTINTYKPTNIFEFYGQEDLHC